jgi:hypothetical protein
MDMDMGFLFFFFYLLVFFCCTLFPFCHGDDGKITKDVFYTLLLSPMLLFSLRPVGIIWTRERCMG